jgi:hypothetical protein
MKKIVMKGIFIILSDIYRIFVHIKEIICDKGDHDFDIAYITNFQNDVECGFLGITSLWKHKAFAPALKLRMHGIRGRYIAINSVAHDMIKNPATGAFSEQMHIARKQVVEAIIYAWKHHAKIILFAASTKRLFSENEIRIFAQRYNMTFTIGDNGTIIALLGDVQCAIECYSITPNDNIVVIGPNGFLGSEVVRYLEKRGFDNVVCISQKDKHPFENVSDVRLVIACSHHPSVRLTADILQKISSTNGVHVVDVCKPSNFSLREFKKSRVDVTRQDAGNMENSNLTYDGSWIACIALKQLHLSDKRLFGCFSEATALATMPSVMLKHFDFLSVNKTSMDIVQLCFERTNFRISQICNFGVKV